MAWRSYLLYESNFFSVVLRNLQFLKKMNNVLWRMRRYMLNMLCNGCTFSRALHWMLIFPTFSLAKHFPSFALDANFPALFTGCACRFSRASHWVTMFPAPGRKCEWTGEHTLLNTPQQMWKHVFQEHIRQNFKILCEHINYSVQSVVTRGRHPLWLLQK